MLDDAERAVLDKHRALLEDYAAQRAHLDASERESRRIVEALERLEQQQSDLPQGGEHAAPDEDDGDISDEDERALREAGNRVLASKESILSAREAAKRIMFSHKRDDWSANDLLRFLEQSQFTINAARPLDAFRTALLRMRESGEVVRIDRGKYALSGDPTEEEAPTPIPTADAESDPAERGEDET